MSLNFILETHSRARNTLGPYIGDVFCFWDTSRKPREPWRCL